MRILVSIVSWNYYRFIENQIPKLIKDLDSRDNVLIIETGKKPIFQTYFHPQLKVIELSENLGYAGAHLIAVEEMLNEKYDGVLIMNPDIHYPQFLITKLKNIIRETKNLCVLGAPIYNLKYGKLKLEYGGYPIDVSTKEILEKGCYSPESGEITLKRVIFPVKDLHGSIIYFPSKIIEKYGWMDTSYFLYGEENEFIHRLNKAKVPIFVCSDLAIIHQDGGTFKRNEFLLNIREYYKTRNSLFNNLIFIGPKYYFRINYLFIIKYFILRYILRLKRFREKNINYYNFLGHIHFLLNIRGKKIDPNDYDF